MTVTAERTRHRNTKKLIFSKKQLLFGYMSIFITVLFFKNTSAAAQWVSTGIGLCVEKLIPSLFPFMIASSLIVSSGVGEVLSVPLRRPMSALFGIDGDGGCAILLGWACGFPIGARCARELYAAEAITADEYQSILYVAATPSPAFVIATVGGAMLGSYKFGLALFAVSILGCIVTGIIFKPKASSSNTRRTISKRPRQSMSGALTRAITGSAQSMLSICAFVIFFCALLGVIGEMRIISNLPGTAKCLFFGIFELTAAVSGICSLCPENAFVLCAAVIGWSGLSVHFQTMSICESDGISFKKYFLACAAKSVLCFLFAAILAPLLGL